jgi:hypothetical protein
VSIASVVGGVAASDAPHKNVLIVGVAADFKSVGTIDPADCVFWRETDGTPAEYSLWRTQFGEPFGEGIGAASFGDLSRDGASLPQSAVPEPGTLVNLIFAAVGQYLRRGRSG